MSSYATFKVGDYNIYSLRNEIDSFTASIYRETDRRLRRVHYDHYYTQPLEDSDLVDCHEYAVSTSVMKARLELMGFTLRKAQSLFESMITEEIERTEKSYLNNIDVLRDATQYERRLLQQLQRDGFDSCVMKLRMILKSASPDFSLYEEPDSPEKENVRAHVLSYRPYFDGEGLFLRTIAEAANPEMEFVLDITSLVSSGWYEAEEAICQDTLNETLQEVRPYQKILILTEGKTDSEILSRALKILHPHLSDYFSFMDFDSIKPESNAAALERMIKSFASAGISHKTIALFDNDAVGVDIHQSLQKIILPPNIKPLLLPNLDLAKDYPTIGAQGVTSADVNGRACSIEMYLGKQVICNKDGSYIPVRWSGLQNRIDQYQGVIKDKDTILKRFSERMDAIESGELSLSSHDWSGLQAIFDVIFREASTL